MKNKPIKVIIAVLFLLLLGGNIIMANLILKTDKLNEGREKINEAIMQSEGALDNSNSSIEIANEALAISENTQEQLNQIVIEGDSSVEAAQARVNADGTVTYNTLKERLDAENQEVISKLADTANQEDLNATNLNVSLKADKLTVDSLVPKRHLFGGQLAKLKESLANPLEQITGIVFIGDSIIWGRTLPEGGAFEPRDGTLSDARDLFISPSFVNEFKRYIGKNYANGTEPVLSNWSASPSGESIAEYNTQNILYPKGGDFTYNSMGTGLSINEVQSPASPAGFQLRLEDSNTAGTSYHSIKFYFTGKSLTLAFACLDSDASFYDLYVNSVKIGTYSTHAGVDGFVNGANNQKRTHDFNYIRDKEVEIRTNRNGEAGTRRLRLEAIIIDKKIRISNQGIIGATSQSFNNTSMPGNTSGDGVAVTGEDNYIFCQFGTNDRGISSSRPKGVNEFKKNLKALIDASIPLADMILMSANPATENPATYSFTMQGTRNAIYQLAKENKLDMIDNYAIFNNIELTTVLPDGVHPNKEGHAIIARNIINSLEN